MNKLNALINAADDGTRRFTNILDFALFLVGIKGHTFISFDAAYPQEKDLLKKNRQTKEPNPFLNRGLTKFARTQATTSFDYEAKVASRDGERGETEGNWQQAVIVKGRLTPLACHKGDIVTRLKDGIDPNSEEAKKVANQVAVMDADGSVQFKTDEPRFYLRYEIQRDAPKDGDESRNDRDMRSESAYLLSDGTPVNKEDLVDYLPIVKPRIDETDHQTATLANIQTIRVKGAVWQRTDAVDVEPILANARIAREALRAQKDANNAGAQAAALVL